jgi:hypothetical protein
MISNLGATSLRMASAGAMVGVTFFSHAQTCNYSGVAILVAHNVLSQTVFISTATVFLPPNQNATVYPFIFGFPPGTTLNSTIFMDTFGGVALSASTIFVFTTF